MDETPEYIKMCEMATKVQEQWDLEDDTNYIGQIIDDYAMTEVWMGYFINSSLKILKANDQGKDYVWLPRQDQLQEMGELLWDYRDRPVWSQYHKLVGFAKRLNSADSSLFKSMEQLWLALVMKEKYNKVWNGEDWVSA